MRNFSDLFWIFATTVVAVVLILVVGANLKSHRADRPIVSTSSR